MAQAAFLEKSSFYNPKFLEGMEQAEISFDFTKEDYETIFSDKDVCAAFVSAFGALLYHNGLASLLGNDEYGSFLLPSTRFWDSYWLRLEVVAEYLRNLADSKELR